MRPKTSVRPPVIAGARRQQLSDLLRAWRRQPRKRSPSLFWGLFVLAFVFDSALALLGIQWLSLADPAPAMPAEERRMYVPYARNGALWEPLRRWVIRVEGRPQLFESFCREAVRRVTGAERFEDNDALAVVVSWMLYGSVWEDYPFLRCEDAELRALLPRKEWPHGSYIEPAVLRRAKKFHAILRGIAAKRGVDEEIQLSPLERETVELNTRLTLFDRIRSGGVDGGESAEMETAKAALNEAYHSDDADVFAAGLTDFLNASRRAFPIDEDSPVARRLAWEGWLNAHRPMRKALSFSMLAAGLLAASMIAGVRRPRWRRGFLMSGLLACAGCLGWSAAAIVCRAILHEGRLVDDGTEGMLGASFIVMSLALTLALLGRDGFIALAGALIAGVGLVLADRWPPAFAANGTALPNMRSDAIWLHLQVVALITAYAALALAWGTAILGLARMGLAPPSAERLRGLALLCIRPIGIAAALLTASAVLDSCRAMGTSDAWRGRNMQTMGMLLALPSCIILLYLRRANRIQPFGVIMLTALGCASLALVGYATSPLGMGNRRLISLLAESAPVCAAGLVSFSLAAHATLRYYCGRQQILES